jgi:hypothetical protein
MSIGQFQRDTLELAFLFAVGITTALLGVRLIGRVPYVDFPYNLNVFFWSIAFILLGILPATAYLCPNRKPRVFAIGLFVFGSTVAVLAPLTDATGTVIYLDGINLLLLVIFALVSVPVTQYVDRAKEVFLLSVVGLVIILYCFTVAYIYLVFVETQDAVSFVPLIGATIIGIGVGSVFISEYQRAGLRRIEA